MTMASGFRFEIDSKSVQRIAPPNPSERFEGIDFSRSGNIMAIATSETNSVLLFQRKPDGRFEDAPFWTISRSPNGLDYPHDVSFSRGEDTELLAVAQRTGAIAIYEKNGSDESYGSEPAFEISGPQSKLAYSDGVAFVPPNNDYLAACNLELGTILFFRRISRSPVAFEETPEFELKHPSVFHPDGLGFSRCGRWLATANHGKRSVSIFQRRNRILSGGKLIYGPEPVTVIQDPQLRYPHSVAFTPRTNHLIVTNAGANYFNVYEPRPHYFGMQWSQSPVAQVIAHEDEAFQEVNTANKMEGGPKGVAIHKNNLAVCSPQIGVKIYSFREQRGRFVRRNRRLKGLDSRYDPASLRRINTLVRFDMANQDMPFEWHELENHPKYGSFRWTGPSPRATIHLPIVFDRDLAVRIHILFALVDEAINTLKVSIHEQDITYRLDRLPEDTFLVLAQLNHAAIAKPKRDFVITLEIANTVRPLDLGGLNQDSRWLGLAVNWVELEPCEQLGSRR
jgi:hypothetical protein